MSKKALFFYTKVSHDSYPSLLCLMWWQFFAFSQRKFCNPPVLQLHPCPCVNQNCWKATTLWSRLTSMSKKKTTEWWKRKWGFYILCVWHYQYIFLHYWRSECLTSMVIIPYPFVHGYLCWIEQNLKISINIFFSIKNSPRACIVLLA